MNERFNTPDQAARLGQQLRDARKKKGLKLGQLASYTGIHHGQISKIERGKMVTVSKCVRKLCTFLEIPCSVDDGGAPLGLLGTRIDALVTALPTSGPAITRLIDALEELVGAQMPRTR